MQRSFIYYISFYLNGMDFSINFCSFDIFHALHQNIASEQ